MLSIKNDKYFKELKNRGILLNRASNHNIVINAINNFNDYLQFDCSYNGFDFIKENVKLVVQIDDKRVDIHQNFVYSDTIFFDITLYKKYTFDFKIYKSDIKDDSSISFWFEYDGHQMDAQISFNQVKPHARLTNLFTHSYWKYDKNDVMLKTSKKIIFKKMGLLGRIKQELLLYRDFITESTKKKLGYQALLLRLLYRMTRPLYFNKRIWIAFDKLYKGGDNGEYFYEYCLNRKEDNVRCYYVINKTAHDYQRLRKQKYILKYKTIHEYLVVLNSECVFATHANPFNFLAFTRGKEKYFRDLMNFDVFCLQHGLTIQDIPHLQNRVNDNTKLYFCASDLEIKNIMQPKYDYEGYDYIKKTGIARFDGLKNNDKKEILITPTWRNNMANSVTNLGGTRPYYKEFKNTVYFKIYNYIINNEKLINHAKKYGYMITYLIHPTLTAQINDFDTNNYVKIYTVTEDQSYEKLLTESSLMVTDYSGIQYDFAYMRKPIIYFHPDELPPHYGSGIDFEKDGFGPIIKTVDQLIDTLCEKMKTGCKNDDKYIKRADDFFLFNDYNSCQRIYDESIKYLNNK